MSVNIQPQPRSFLGLLTEAMELLLDRLGKVKANADFLNSMSAG